MKSLSLIKISLLASVLLSSGYSVTAEAAKGSPAAAASVKSAPTFEPIIAHELSLNISYLLTLNSIDKDAKKIQSPEEAATLYASTDAAIKALGTEDHKAAPLPIYKDVLSLIQFYMGRVPNKDNTAKIKNLGDSLEKSAANFAALTKNTVQQAQALYYVQIGKYIKSDGTDGISDLIPLKDKLKDNKDMVNAIDLMVGYSLASSPSSQAQGLQTMARVNNDVSIYGRLATKLSEAVIEFGLDADGQSVGAIKSTAESKLSYCVQLARAMPAGLQHIVMNSAAYIWVKANPNDDKRSPAFMKDGFPAVVPVDFMRERDALIELRAANYQAASALYKKIASAYQPGPAQSAVDSRIWELDILQFQKTGSMTELEASFAALRAKYLPQGKKGFYAMVGDSYRKVLDSNLDAGLSPQGAAAQKTMAIQFATKYLATEQDRVIAYPLKAKLALLYRSQKMFREAVETYLDIAKDQPLKNYVMAIESQSQLASWSNIPDFTNKSKDKVPERQKLLSIYETVGSINKNTDWGVISHVGLLNRVLGNTKAAEQLWTKTLASNPAHKYANEAAGLMLSEYNTAARHDELIELIHLVVSKKVTPTLKAAPVNYKPWLADSLFKAGNAELSKNNLPKAVKYLEEFTIVFPTEPRFASAGHSLALGYKGMNKLVPALNMSKGIAEKFPKYPLRAKLLLQAGEWAAATQPTWEFAFYFYTKYLTDFKTEANIPTIRTTLAELYFKRKLYGWSSRLYREQSVSPQVPKDQQLKAAARAMEIEDQFGEAKEAYGSAQRVIALAGPADPSRYRAFAFMGRYVANNKDLKGMNDLEQKIVPLVKMSKDVMEAVGFMRYRRAELLFKPIVNNENNLQLRDPDATVKKYYGRFEEERKNYLNVCQIGITAYCAPAMLKLTTIARQGQEAVEKITIAETLGPNRVNGFKVFKQLQVSKILQAKKDYGDTATRLVKQGTTTPAWREEILKALEYDQNLAH
ncbi:MAG: hypothetical protein V4655_00875 [Bdellovibrionota bacterium]